MKQLFVEGWEGLVELAEMINIPVEIADGSVLDIERRKRKIENKLFEFLMI